jgi:hypothetical protein
MPKVYTSNKYRLSRTAGANKVILFCHGGWSFSDGFINLPKGFFVRFYTTHGLPNGSATEQAKALAGGRGDAPLPFALIQQILNLPKDEQDQALLDAKAEHNRSQNATSLVVERVGKEDEKVTIYNYKLSYDGPREDEGITETAWSSHSSGLGPYSSAIFDFMCLKQNAPAAHLKSAIAFALGVNKNYRKMHFLACRYVRQDDTQAWATVQLPEKLENVIQSDLRF